MLKNKIKKLYGILLIIIFFLFLILPIIKISKGGQVSRIENRTLAPFPKKLGRHRIEEFLNDNIGFRNFFVNIVGNIKYRVFNQSLVNRVELGEDGFVFYKGNDNIKIAAGTYEITPEQLENIKNTQLKLRDYLKEKGIEFLIILPPSKASVYPEKVKGGFYKVGISPVDIVYKYLTENTDLNVISVKDALIREKQHNLLFFKTDTHWNEYGAYVAYKDIISKMNQLGIINTQPVDMTFVEKLHRGDLNGIMGNNKLLPMEKYMAGNIVDSHISIVEIKGELKTAFDKIAPLKSRCRYIKNEMNTAPKILMYGDSYFNWWNMPNLLSEHFSEFFFFRIRQLTWNNEISGRFIEIYDPDIVVLEITERFISELGNTLNEKKLYDFRKKGAL